MIMKQPENRPGLVHGRRSDWRVDGNQKVAGSIAAARTFFVFYHAAFVI
jgi:hypothetical protein